MFYVTISPRGFSNESLVVRYTPEQQAEVEGIIASINGGGAWATETAPHDRCRAQDHDLGLYHPEWLTAEQRTQLSTLPEVC